MSWRWVKPSLGRRMMADLSWASLRIPRALVLQARLTCVGASFAMAEMMVFLSVLLQRLDVTADPSIIPVPGARLTLRPQTGMRLTLTPRS